MRTYLTSQLFFLLCLVMSSSSDFVRAQDGTPNDPEKQLEREGLHALVKNERQRQSIPGLSVAIRHKGDTQLIYVGDADLENRVPVTAVTRFRTASVAKSFTAVLCLKLHELGLLDLDAPVQKYVSEFPEKEWQVTSRQLLGHLGGIRHYRDSQEASAKDHFSSLSEALQVFAADPLMHEPGSKYHYSSFGYNLLGLVAERAAKATYPQLLEKYILEPAGLHYVEVDQHYQLIANRSRGYRILNPQQLSALGIEGATKSQMVNADLHDTSMKIPGGGLLATPNDLSCFGEALTQGMLLKKETMEMMWTEQQTSDGKPTTYGLGWRIGSLEQHKAVWHSGAQAGTSTYLLLIPDQGISIGIMSNLQGSALAGLANEIAKKCVARALLPETD